MPLKLVMILRCHLLTKSQVLGRLNVTLMMNILSFNRTLKTLWTIFAMGRNVHSLIFAFISGLIRWNVEVEMLCN